MTPLPLYISLEYSEDPLEVLRTEFRLSPDEMTIAEELIELGFPPLVRPEMISYLFGISDGLIQSMSEDEDRHYRIFSIPKSGGGTRQIEAPRRFLKSVQRWIYNHILSKYEFPFSVTGFVPGKNIFTNAEPHLQSKNLMVVDIEDFFPSVDQRLVNRIFKRFKFPSRVAYRLTGLCIFSKRLPQGAPTSPALANISFSRADRLLEDLANQWGCVYTRYADDLAFSGERVFSGEDMETVSDILRQSGFNINRQKSRIVGAGARQVVAGLVVNESGLPPRRQRKRWRATFHQAELNPSNYIGQSSRLKGIAAFINEYDSSLAEEHWDIANRVSALEERS